MLTRTSETLDSALSRLAPDDRALLELSLRRRVPDDEIAGLLHVETHEVELRRGRALGRLAEDLDVASTDELADLLASGWDAAVKPAPGNGSRRANGAASVPAVIEPVPASRKGRLQLLLAVLVVAGVGAIALVISGGKEEASTPPAAPTRPAPGGTAGVTAQLVPVGPSQGARGTASLKGFALSVRTQGLAPSADYELWLYDSVGNATPVGHLRGGRVDARLPSGFARYRYIDVSREPADGNPNHSGASVLRAPVSALKR